MKLIKRFVLMVQFFTTIPVKLSIDANEEDLGKGMSLAPVIGLVLGCIISLVHYGASFITERMVSAVIVIISYMILTGGLHLDGLADTFDGVFSYRSKERMLEIMKDSRIGTIGVLAITGVILFDTVLIAGINDEIIIKILILLPVAGRMGSLTGAAVSSYARKEKGLGKSFIEKCGKKDAAFGMIVPLIIFIILLGCYKGVVLFAAVVLVSLLLTKWITGKIGGATGDVLGAVTELTQMIFLFSSLVFLK